MEGAAGVTETDTRAAAVTDNCVEPVTAFNVAEIVDVPAFTLLARPRLPVRLLIVAVPLVEDAQVTDVVILTVRAGPVNVPVATNCCDWPRGMDGFTGVTAIDVSPFALPVPLRPTRIGLPKAP